MTKPCRIQRKRTKGFNMQWESPNGLPVVYVGRPSAWGNPVHGRGKTAVADHKKIMSIFKAMHPKEFQLWIAPLRGKNLACWCPIIDKQDKYCQCHADILLSLSNNMSIEDVRRENIKVWERAQKKI